MPPLHPISLPVGSGQGGWDGVETRACWVRGRDVPCGFSFSYTVLALANSKWEFRLTYAGGRELGDMVHSLKRNMFLSSNIEAFEW